MKLHMHQFLSKTGKFRRKKDAIESIKNSEIKLDAKTILNPDYRFNPERHKVFWNDNELSMVEDYKYYIINKPQGYLSSKLTAKDIALEKKSVFSLIKCEANIKNTLVCVGRLDEDTSGLLIITNDGKLSHRITNPNSEIKKTYVATLSKPLTEEEIKKIESGPEIVLEENGKLSRYKTRPCKLEMVSGKEVKLVLTEGKKREVKRIFESVGNSVISLRRESIGNLILKNLGLGVGEYITLDKKSLEEKLFT